MKHFDLSLFDNLVPVRSLPGNARETLVDYLELVTFPVNDIIFSQGDDDNMTCYLCDGLVELSSSDGSCLRIKSGTEDARYPLSQVHPRQYTARALTQCSILVINRSKLDELMALHGVNQADEYDGMVVSELDPSTDTDWMSYLLASELFSRVSANNIQNIFSRIEAIDVYKGEEVIHQGEHGEYFYIIKQGTCDIYRQPSGNSRPIRISQLHAGDTFGEEALITGNPRSVSVIMSSDGELLKLHKNDFEKYLLSEVVQGVEFRELQKQEQDDIVIIDVRYPDEIDMPLQMDSVNIPLNVLRIELNKLDRNRRYITVCSNGIKSRVAVFLLAQHGIEARHVTNGLVSCISLDEPDSGLNPVLVNDGHQLPHDKEKKLELMQAQGELINTLKNELEELRSRLDQSVSERDLAEQAVRAAERKAQETISNEYGKIRETMQKAISVYEEVRTVKEKLLEDRVALRKLIEKQKKRQEEVVHSIEEETRNKVSNELKKIEEFYSLKEEQIRQIQKLKAIAEKRLQKNQEQGSQNRCISNKTLSARLQILKDSKFRERINNLRKQETDDLIEDITRSREQPEGDTPAAGQGPGTPVDIDSINRRLEQQSSGNGMNISGEGNNYPGIDKPASAGSDDDIQQWLEEQKARENSQEELRKLREKREIIRRIYEHAEKNRTISRIHDKALITEITSALGNNPDKDNGDSSDKS